MAESGNEVFDIVNLVSHTDLELGAPSPIPVPANQLERCKLSSKAELSGASGASGASRTIGTVSSYPWFLGGQLGRDWRCQGSPSPIAKKYSVN